MRKVGLPVRREGERATRSRKRPAEHRVAGKTRHEARATGSACAGTETSELCSNNSFANGDRRPS
jgi:hypothetical protein